MTRIPHIGHDADGTTSPPRRPASIAPAVVFVVGILAAVFVAGALAMHLASCHVAVPQLCGFSGCFQPSTHVDAGAP